MQFISDTSEQCLEEWKLPINAFIVYAKRILHNNSYYYHYLLDPFCLHPSSINNNNLSTICKHSIGHSMSSRFSHRFGLHCLNRPWLAIFFHVTGGGIVTILGSLFSCDGGCGTVDVDWLPLLDNFCCSSKCIRARINVSTRPIHPWAVVATKSSEYTTAPSMLWMSNVTTNVWQNNSKFL